MIDTDKYEGHRLIDTYVVVYDERYDNWAVGNLPVASTHVVRDSQQKGSDEAVCGLNEPTAHLIADAPLLLEEVERLREVLRDVKSDIDSYLSGGWNGVEGWEAISSIIGALGIQTDMDLMMEESE